MRKKRNLSYAIWLIVWVLVFPVNAQQKAPEPLPIDSAVRYGVLPNGLTYYIRHNEYPKDRAEFYIAQKVGSILEEEDQRGLAHFLEHMAFNGTKNFPEKTLLTWLQSIGVKFGADVNAYTSFDETVYNISNVPTTRESIIDSCILILHDWASEIALEDEEIDNERGVITEEWRTRADASSRMWDKSIPVLFAGSRYADRMPIGKMEIVQNFPYQLLRDYYHKWYRPDLQGIIIVGDFDADRVEKKVKEVFGSIRMPENAAERVYYQVPDNEEPIVAIATDKEASNAIVTMFFKHDQMPGQLKATIAGLADNYIKMAITSMLNTRLEELTQKADAPFLGATSSDGAFVVSNTKDAFAAAAAGTPEKLEEAFAALVRELERVRRYGFTESEYERAKAQILSYIDNLYAERNNRYNSSYVQEYVDHFINGGSITGVEREVDLLKSIIQDIPDVGLINQVAKTLIGDKNIAFAITAPEQDGISYPSAEQLVTLFQKIRQEEIAPYADTVSNQPLMENLPKPGRIVKEKENKQLGTTTWTLSNGVTVILKPTDFQKDEIGFRAYSPGGGSLYDDSDILSLQVINSVMGISKFGGFTQTELTKMLAGKQAYISSYVQDNYEGLQGSSTVKDLKTLMQLIYLTFTDADKDEAAFTAWKERVETSLKNQEADPATAFNDTLNMALYQGHPRTLPVKSHQIADIDYDRILEIYRDRFSDASDFTFTFVGNLNLDTMRVYAEQYLASLPDLDRKEKGKFNVYLRKGKDTRLFEKTMETPKSSVTAVFSGKCKFTPENSVKMDILTDILRQMYVESIREKEGGTYGVQVGGSIDAGTKTFALNFSFDTNKELRERLLNLALQELKQLAEKGPDPKYVSSVKEYWLKSHSQHLKMNGYWLQMLELNHKYGIDNISDYNTLVEKQTPESIRKFARQLLKQGNEVIVSMDGVKE